MDYSIGLPRHRLGLLEHLAAEGPVEDDEDFLLT
jgi:hypothetical protein